MGKPRAFFNFYVVIANSVCLDCVQYIANAATRT